MKFWREFYSNKMNIFVSAWFIGLITASIYGESLGTAVFLSLCLSGFVVGNYIAYKTLEK